MKYKLLQKTAALLLAFILCFGLLSPAAAAEQASGNEPLIYVPDYSELSLFETEGETMREVYNLSSTGFLQTLVSMVAGLLVASEDPVRGAQRLNSAIDDVFYPISFNAEGEPLNDRVRAAAPAAKPYSLSSGDPVKKENLKAILSAAGESITEKDLYVFTYDWRLSPVENASLLNAFLDEVLAVSGRARARLLSGGYGGVIVNAFLYASPENAAKKVSRCVFLDSFLLGSSLIGDLMSGKLTEAAKRGFASEDPFSILKPDDTSDAARLHNAVASYAKQDPNGYAARALTALLGDNAYMSALAAMILALASSIVSGEGVYGQIATGITRFASGDPDLILSNGLRTYLRYIPGLWALVPVEEYENAVTFLFGATVPTDALSEKLDAYRAVQLGTEATLKAAVKAGVGIAIVAGYGRQILPLTAEPDEQSDSIAATRYAAPGVTTDDVSDTVTLETRCGVRRHKHVSPDGLLDANTCFLPEQTWFIKNHRHMEYGTKTVAAFVAWLFRGENAPTVHDSSIFPQYLLSSLATGEISAYTTPDSPFDCLYGDLDGNGKITSADARLALRFSVDLEFPSRLMAIAADVDNDNYITAADARLILRYSVGLEADFPVERI